MAEASVSSPDVYRPTPPCAQSAPSCLQAKDCVIDVVYWLDIGVMSPGVQEFTRQQDAVAYVRSLGFQGALTGDFVEFTVGGASYVFAALESYDTFVVVDRSGAPDVYAAIVRYAQCMPPQDASAYPEDAATE